MIASQEVARLAGEQVFSALPGRSLSIRKQPGNKTHICNQQVPIKFARVSPHFFPALSTSKD